MARSPREVTDREAALRARLARNVLTLAGEQDLSMHALAAATGLSRAHMHLVLRGTANCSLRWLVAVADALGVEVWELLQPTPTGC